MPLVTRQANQGFLFKQDADPASSAVAGDLWSETNTNTLSRRNDADNGWLEVIPSPVVTALQLNDTSADHQYIFTVNELTADRNVNMPLLTGNDIFVFNDFAATLTNKTIALGSNTVTGTSAELATAISDETGSSLLVFNTSPTFVTPLLGTPASGVLTNCTGLPEAGLLDNAVTLAKMAGGTDGNLITYDISGDPAFVTTGTAAQVLTSNGAGAAPTFQSGGGLWEVLGDYEATTPEATTTLSFTGVDFSDDSIIVLQLGGSVTLSLALLLRYNNLTAPNYYVDGRRITGGTETLIDIDDASSSQIMSTSLLNAAGRFFGGTVNIMFGGKDAERNIRSFSTMVGRETDGNETVSGTHNDTEASITDVTIMTSTSTWTIGTRFTIYKLARA